MGKMITFCGCFITLVLTMVPNAHFENDVLKDEESRTKRVGCYTDLLYSRTIKNNLVRELLALLAC